MPDDYTAFPDLNALNKVCILRDSGTPLAVAASESNRGRCTASGLPFIAFAGELTDFVCLDLQIQARDNR